MLGAAGWGLLAASSLLIGAVAGYALALPERAVGLILGFGAGALISAVSFELTDEAFRLGGADVVSIGLAAGALTFFFGDAAIDRRGGEGRKKLPKAKGSSPGPGGPGGSSALLLGAVLDGIPESAVLGTTLLAGHGVSIAVLAAVFVSNLPEAIGGTVAERSRGRSLASALRPWILVVGVSALSAGLGFTLLDGASGSAVGLLQAFAAGGVLVMLVDEMIPAAFEHGGRPTGLVTVLGFAGAYLLSTA